MDKSNGYEEVASIFIQNRGQNTAGIGTSSVRAWARTLSPGSTVLDLGCGTGIPISQALIAEGLKVYGVDASPTIATSFQKNFPQMPIACESVEESLFFHRLFDGIICWGLLFLLSEPAQTLLLQKAAKALNTGGKLLFTAPSLTTSWQDVMTGRASISLGAEKYRGLLNQLGLDLIREFDDEGENHYYEAIKR